MIVTINRTLTLESNLKAQNTLIYLLGCNMNVLHLIELIRDLLNSTVLYLKII